MKLSAPDEDKNEKMKKIMFQFELILKKEGERGGGELAPLSMIGVEVPGSLLAALRKMRSKTSLPKVSKISVISTNLLG